MMQAIRIMNANTLTMSAIGLSKSFIPNSVYTQCIRWKRKPIWLPPAKSKLKTVPKGRITSIEEKEEFQYLNNHYRTYMTSLRSYMVRAYKENKKVQFDEEFIKQMEEKDFQVCSALNDEWNAEIVKEREVRLDKTRKERKEYILQTLTKHEEKQTRLRIKYDEQIKKAKQEAPTFITAENVDVAIEECLTNTIDHNRALDMKGNWHVEKFLSSSSGEETKQNSIVAEQ